MEKNRIQINGVWYVREDCPKEEVTVDIDTLVDIKGCIYENSDFCWEATVLCRDYESGEIQPEVDIKFTDKRVKPWKEENWDNNFWLQDLYEGEPNVVAYAEKLMSSKGVKQFQAFLKQLVKRGWLQQ
jgi:hypothetical protein